MSSLDGQDLFASGPHSIRPETWSRDVQRRGFAGVDGEAVLDMGLRSRRIVQTGRLQAASASAIHSLIAAIEAAIDGNTHMLVDDLGRTYPTVLVEKFEPNTPVKHSRGFWCDYTVLYRQLP
jgi:hypothetical protein